MADLDELRAIFELKRLMRGKSPDISPLEKEFLSFSAYMPNKTLTVRLPKLYPVQGDEKSHLEEALKAAGIDEKVNEVDISGAFDIAKASQSVFFLSPNQVNSDHYSYSRSHLNALIEKVYTEGRQLISGFTIHEAVFGRVECFRGDLNLDEVHLFPDDFRPGPYELRAALDTPGKTITRFIELSDIIEGIEKDPKEILDPAKVVSATEKARALRQILGSLSRYETPGNRQISAETNSYIARLAEATLIYMYSEELKQNIAIVFGKNPFARNPKNLTVVPGEDPESLRLMVEKGIFEASDNVIDQRIKDLTLAYQETARAEGRDIRCEYPRISDLLNRLIEEKRRFEGLANARSRKQYALTISRDLLEFVVYPKTEDPVVHQLMARLSGSEAIRKYQDTPMFVHEFSAAEDPAKTAMLESVKANLIFSNQQNNDVNVWLYRNHRQFCENAGLKFEVVK